MELTTNRYVFCNACSRCGNGFYGENCGSVEDDTPTVISAELAWPACGSGDIDICPRCGREQCECECGRNGRCGNGCGNSRCGGCGNGRCGNGCGNSRCGGCGNGRCGNGCGNSRCGGCGNGRCGNGCGNSRCCGCGNNRCGNGCGCDC